MCSMHASSEGYFEGEPLPCPSVWEIAGREAADSSPSADHEDLAPESHVYDAMAGEDLDLVLVRSGRLKELAQMQLHGVFKEVQPSEAKGWRVRSRWVGDARVKNGVKEVRSRLVAMEFNTFGREGVNEAMPPIMAVRLVVSRAASKGPRRNIAIYDVSVAFSCRDR